MKAFRRRGASSVRIPRLATAAILVTTFCGSLLMAQEASKPEVLLEDGHNGFVFALDNKFTQVHGKFANFVGLYGGWLVNHQFLIGLGGYGKTTGVHELQMGYGGLMLEYYVNPDRLVNFSVRGLIGAGASSMWWADPFFVAEPEARMTVNVTRWMRMGFGGGYRFIGGAPWHDDRLRGFTASVELKCGRF
jgi:hypothetical protein